MKFLKNDRGAAAVEFGLLAVPVIGFILAIIEFGWVLWIDNALNIAVDTAARCGAVQSTTIPCNGIDMVTTANTVFPLTAPAGTFTNNTSCQNDGGSGLVGAYNASIGVWVWSVSITLTATSCYPTVSAS
jgi:Flp pilus assembly protein TadG